MKESRKHWAGNPKMEYRKLPNGDWTWVTIFYKEDR